MFYKFVYFKNGWSYQWHPAVLIFSRVRHFIMQPFTPADWVEMIKNYYRNSGSVVNGCRADAFCLNDHCLIKTSVNRSGKMLKKCKIVIDKIMIHWNSVQGDQNVMIVLHFFIFQKLPKSSLTSSCLNIQQGSPFHYASFHASQLYGYCRFGTDRLN